MEFSYFMPVRLLFGANVIDQLGATAKSYGTHALIVTGRSSTKRSGLLDRSIALLEAAGVRATVFNKVEPNPLTTTVMEGAALAREQGCDLVIGVGGGHGMEHPVSGMYNVVHGKGLAALTPPLFRHSYNTKPERYAAISRLLGGKDETDCAEAVERFLKSIDLNCKLRELGVEESGIDWMTDNCINVFAGSMRNHTKALTRDEVKQIYLEAF